VRVEYGGVFGRGKDEDGFERGHGKKGANEVGGWGHLRDGSRENLGGVRGAVLAEMSLVTLDDITVKLLKLGR
jgi:hypothetical protein